LKAAAVFDLEKPGPVPHCGILNGPGFFTFISEQGLITMGRTNIFIMRPRFAEDPELKNGLQVLTGVIFIYGLLRLEIVQKHERRPLC